MGAHNQNSLQSKADQTVRISKSVFVSHFPEGCTAKDLWMVCNDYGTVVDVFIPTKKSNVGKRFAFVRFIKRFLKSEVVYLGGLWVMIELTSSKSKAKFLKHVGVASWFICLSNAQSDFVSVIALRSGWTLKGVPMHECVVSTTFHKIGSKWGEVLDLEECKDDFFARKRICIKTNQEDNILEKFKIIVKGKIFVVRAKELFTWSLTFTDVSETAHCSDDDSDKEVGVKQSVLQQFTYLESAQKIDKHFPSEAHGNGLKHREGGSILEVLEEMIKETKMENISAMDVKFLWGNSNFDYIFSEAIDNSGGILCTWDPNVFQNRAHIISSINFIALCGIWFPFIRRDLMISVYAPQTVSNKRVLWTYLTSLINRWNGESIVMGDFNEVRRMEERWGSTFNVNGARAFNNFISNSGLVDLQLEGYTFTWAHPSATKMSKLDRFLTTDGLLSLFPHVSAACLDRHFLDHRPILLREEDETVWPCNDLKSNEDMTGDIGSKWIKRANLAVKGIMIDGDWVDDPSRVKDEFRNHFAARFQDPGICHGKINFSFPNRLNHEQSTELESSITREEIRNAVWGCGENKSPGPDGFTFEFFFRKFGSKWRSWIRGCLNSGMASILVNGSPTSEFQFHRGLKQGDPLAPYLFILVMESLHLSFTRVIEAGIFTGVRIDPSTMISHLFYADDVVFIGEWSQDNLKGIMHSLRCFSLLSGLSINIKKSHLLCG
ncbi:RNA-directed DNA polymerase, eukaryota [Tanacetum coccineum]|uniref:RNA-directed DNA polymerase, eukaryota n=1 Tax=Tanacetum coccineum TaxID=301880 RepID=A0ABQ5JEQ4_9ASTR